EVMSKSSPSGEGMARRKAQNLWWSASPFGRGGGRLSARQHALSLVRYRAWRIELRSSRPEADSACKNRACSFGGDLADTGPRFRLDITLKARGRSRDIRSSASSWQALVVVPGGVPVPPECLVANQTRGAPRPVPPIMTPHERA